MKSKCKSYDTKCEDTLDAEAMKGIIPLMRIMFGPFGHRLVVGYCRICARKNIAQVWMALIIVVAMVVAIIELPWKGPMFAFVLIGFWSFICWSWLFPSR